MSIILLCKDETKLLKFITQFLKKVTAFLDFQTLSSGLRLLFLIFLK